MIKKYNLFISICILLNIFSTIHFLSGENFPVWEGGGAMSLDWGGGGGKAQGGNVLDSAVLYGRGGQVSN